MRKSFGELMAFETELKEGQFVEVRRWGWGLDNRTCLSVRDFWVKFQEKQPSKPTIFPSQDPLLSRSPVITQQASKLSRWLPNSGAGILAGFWVS